MFPRTAGSTSCNVSGTGMTDRIFPLSPSIMTSRDRPSSEYSAAAIRPSSGKGKGLKIRPEHLLIDGNRFNPYQGVPYTTVVKGDGKYMSIAAASVLAKTYRDDYMNRLHEEFPVYDWIHNKGYPTPKHRSAIAEHGITPYHRKSFNLIGNEQLVLSF